MAAVAINRQGPYGSAGGDDYDCCCCCCCCCYYYYYCDTASVYLSSNRLLLWLQLLMVFNAVNRRVVVTCWLTWSFVVSITSAATDTAQRHFPACSWQQYVCKKWTSSLKSVVILSAVSLDSLHWNCANNI